MIEITVQEIEEGRKLYRDFLMRTGGGFYASLFDLMPHADRRNLYRLATAFPGEVHAYLEWTQRESFRWSIIGEGAQVAHNDDPNERGQLYYGGGVR